MRSFRLSSKTSLLHSVEPEAKMAPPKTFNTPLKQAVRSILKRYQGLTVTPFAIASQLRDAGFTVSRPTVTKHMLDVGCIATQRGLYLVPTKLGKKVEVANEPTTAI
jgi:hypothetical protein